MKRKIDLSEIFEKYKKAFIDNKKEIIRKVFYGAILIISLVFIFNLFKTNKVTDDLSKADMKENAKSLNRIVASATVDAVQAQLDAMEQSNSIKVAETVKARFKRKFANSIVVGDSLTEGLPLYGYLSEDQVVSKIGASIIYGDDMFKKASSARPKNVFLAFGMNDMGNYRGDAKAFINRYSELIDMLHKDSPKTKIYICSISTPREDAIKDNASIAKYAEFNEAISKMCKDKKLTYIDISKILPEHPEKYAPDGIHADASYYPLWLNMMAEAAGL